MSLCSRRFTSGLLVFIWVRFCSLGSIPVILLNFLRYHLTDVTPLAGHPKPQKEAKH